MHKTKKIKFLFDKKEIQTTRLQMGMVVSQESKPLTIKNMSEAHDILDRCELLTSGSDYFVVRVK